MKHSKVLIDLSALSIRIFCIKKQTSFESFSLPCTVKERNKKKTILYIYMHIHLLFLFLFSCCYCKLLFAINVFFFVYACCLLPFIFISYIIHSFFCSVHFCQCSISIWANKRTSVTRMQLQ